MFELPCKCNFRARVYGLHICSYHLLHRSHKFGAAVRQPGSVVFSLFPRFALDLLRMFHMLFALVVVRVWGGTSLVLCRSKRSSQLPVDVLYMRKRTLFTLLLRIFSCKEGRSVAVLAELSLTSTRKLLVFLSKYIFLLSKYPKNDLVILKETSLEGSCACDSHLTGRSRCIQVGPCVCRVGGHYTWRLGREAQNVSSSFLLLEQTGLLWTSKGTPPFT